MRIEIKKFGDILTSHPAGRDAFLVASAYIFPDCTNENIILDFAGVEVLSPSWGDEFITKVDNEKLLGTSDSKVNGVTIKSKEYNQVNVYKEKNSSWQCSGTNSP